MTATDSKNDTRCSFLSHLTSSAPPELLLAKNVPQEEHAGRLSTTLRTSFCCLDSLER